MESLSHDTRSGDRNAVVHVTLASAAAFNKVGDICDCRSYYVLFHKLVSVWNSTLVFHGYMLYLLLLIDTLTEKMFKKKMYDCNWV